MSLKRITKTAPEHSDPRNAYTPKELRRMHLHFGHASARKLYELLKRSQDTAPPNTLNQIEQIVDACQTCKEFSPKSVSFKIRAPDKVLFNHRIVMDLMWLPTRQANTKRSTRPLLHIIDLGTRFNAAIFLENESASHVRNGFLRAWASLYTGLPASILVDQGSVFMSEEWNYACSLNDIELTNTGTESHNSLGAGEAYHAYLRRIYNKLHHDYKTLDDPTTLALSIKAINDCTGPKGLCPTLLVFGTMPQLPSPHKRTYSEHSNRIRAAAAAREEYEKIVSSERIALAAKTRPPPATTRTIAPGDLVYVYRERAQKHTGPHMVASVNGKSVRRHIGDRNGPRAFNIAQTKPSPLPNAFHDGSTEPTYTQTILHTEIIPNNDPRSNRFDDAKRKELLGLLERGAFRICLKEEAGPDANIIPSRYVLAIKHGGNPTDVPILKARFVLGGHRDKERDKLVHDARTVRPESLRLLVALGTILGLNFTVADWKQGYVQSKSELRRKVFIKPQELNLAPDELVRVLRPVYGLPDAGEYWSDTLSNHLREHCQFQQSATDLSLWLRTVAGKLLALAATYVDDVLLAATPSALEEFKRISRNRFDVTFNDTDPMNYCGLRISTRNDGTRAISQPRQIDRLKLLPHNANFDDYRSARAAMAWLIQTRPDIAYLVSHLARFTKETFNAKSIRLYNKAVKYLRETRHIELLYPRLDARTLRLVCYTDGGYSNTSDGKGQVGFVIALADGENRCAILAYVSRKSRRVVKSSTSIEALAFAEGFDHVFAIKADLVTIIKKSIPLIMLTDSEILFNTLTRRKTTTERRLMLDLRIARSAYSEREISNIALIASEHNPADALTKLNPNSALRKIMDTGKISHPIRQYVIEQAKVKRFI